MLASTGLVIAAAALLAAGALGVLLRRRAGRFHQVDLGRGHHGELGGASGGVDPLLASLGVTAGPSVTLLQFSSAFCAPCRATRLLCTQIASWVPGVHHIEVDAESHVDAVRRLDIWRTPTLFIIDAAGRIRRRASGAPTRDQLLAAVAEVVPLGTPRGTKPPHGRPAPRGATRNDIEQ